MLKFAFKTLEELLARLEQPQGRRNSIPSRAVLKVNIDRSIVQSKTYTLADPKLWVEKDVITALDTSTKINWLH